MALILQKKFHLPPDLNFSTPGSKQFDAKMVVHIATQKTDVSSTLELKKHLPNE